MLALFDGRVYLAIHWTKGSSNSNSVLFWIRNWNNGRIYEKQVFIFGNQRGLWYGFICGGRPRPRKLPRGGPRGPPLKFPRPRPRNPPWKGPLGGGPLPMCRDPIGPPIPRVGGPKLLEGGPCPYGVPLIWLVLELVWQWLPVVNIVVQFWQLGQVPAVDEREVEALVEYLKPISNSQFVAVPREPVN